MTYRKAMDSLGRHLVVLSAAPRPLDPPEVDLAVAGCLVPGLMETFEPGTRHLPPGEPGRAGEQCAGGELIL